MRKQIEQVQAQNKYNQELRQAQIAGKVLIQKFLKCLLYAKAQKLEAICPID